MSSPRLSKPLARITSLVLVSICIGNLTVETGAQDSEWTPTTVPGAIPLKGFGWYRAWLKPHSSFFIKHERDLFGESTVMSLRGFAGAHELYINGERIGSGGQFPPNFRDGRDSNHRHKVPPGTLKPEQWNEIAIRVYAPGTDAGFVTEPPFIMDYFWECVFAGTWEFRSGDTPDWLEGPKTTKPERGAFDSFHESNRVLGEAETFVTGEKLSPADSLAKMSTPDDLQVELLLAEPLVAQPTHMSFDSKGRLWVAQYRQYPYPAGLKMISRDRYYRSHYDRIPPAPPHHDRGRDQISIHEDTNGDGNYDRHLVFQDGLNMANAALRGAGGVWVMHTPYLLYYPDRDFDDQPDGAPEVHLQGFGMEDNHSVSNGLVWGMDGWLYGAQGSTTSCHITRPGIDPPDADGVYYQGCMVWRYHPGTRQFEIFSEGGGNNFGLEVDAEGRLFTGHNGGNTRGWHFVQGGMHLMQGRTPNKFGPPRNPYALGELPMMANEQPVKRFTHFGVMAESTAIPDIYRDTFFSLDPLHNFVIASRRKTRGATFSTSDQIKVLSSDDFAFRPVFIANAPDGSVLVADFYEHYIAHGQHYQSQIDPSTGRIFRLRGRTESLENDLNLHAKSTQELLTRLNHPNKWHRQTAVRLLGERKDAASVPALEAKIKTGSPVESLPALWAMHQAFGLNQEAALDALRHPHAPTRYWATRLLCDDFGFANKRRTPELINSLGSSIKQETELPEPLFAALLKGAQEETNAEVRSQFAASARRLPPHQALPLVAELLKHAEDISDPYIPLMCWWVIEHYLDSARATAMALLLNRDWQDEPMMRTHILRRAMQALATKGNEQDLHDCARLFNSASKSEVTQQLVQGFEQAYEGRHLTGLPAELLTALRASGNLSTDLKLRLGEPGSLEQALSNLRSANSKTEEKVRITRTLGELQNQAALGELRNLMTQETNPPLQIAALNAVASIDDSPSTANSLLTLLPTVSPQIRTIIFDLLLTRIPWTDALLIQLEQGHLPTTLLSTEIRDRLQNHHSSKVAARFRKIQRGSAQPIPASLSDEYQRLAKALETGTGNPYAGEATYQARCGVCHKLFHKGGNIGPDLTPYQRKDTDALLRNILEPNLEIREGFESVVVTTDDERELTGFLIDDAPRTITLRGLNGQSLSLERSNVTTVTPTGRSLMPEGLLTDLEPQALRDLFAYLRISQPISH